LPTIWICRRRRQRRIVLRECFDGVHAAKSRLVVMILPELVRFEAVAVREPRNQRALEQKPSNSPALCCRHCWCTSALSCEKRLDAIPIRYHQNHCETEIPNDVECTCPTT